MSNGFALPKETTAKDCRKMLKYVKFVFWGQKLRKAPQQCLRRCEWNKALSDSLPTVPFLQEKQFMRII